MSGYTPVPSAPPPQGYNAPPSYDPVGPSSYGTVDYDAYQQPQPAYAQTTTFAGYPTHETGYQQQPVHETVYQQQPVYATTTTTAVTTQPGVPRYRPPKPSTHIWLSVFTMICCCFVLGLIAIIVGMEVDTAYNLGDDARARQKSQQALGLSIAAIGFGVVIHLGWIGAVVYFVVVVGNALHGTSS